MYGTKEEFDYVECPECGSLQIREVPRNLSSFYPERYYSFNDVCANAESLTWPRTLMRGVRTDYWINRRNVIGWVIDKLRPNYFDLDWEWFRHSHVSTKSRVLDVGCGAGALLKKMHTQGFQRLTGIDPHVKESITLPGLRILKGKLSELTGPFDFIMLHHSLEHMPAPLAVLGEVRQLLRPGGHALVRLPIAGTYAWKRYGINWIGLDPPRHIFVPTMRGMTLLAQRGGFEIKKSWFNSLGQNLFMSEKHEVGLPGYDEGARAFTFEHLFSKQRIDEFQRRAEELNEPGEGDTACFILAMSD